METASDVRVPLAEPAELPSERGKDWPLASVFFSAVVAQYAVLAYVAYALIF